MQVLGYAYPAYLCYKDMEGDKADRLKLWCMYWWVVVAAAAVMMMLLSMVVVVELDADSYYSL